MIVGIENGLGGVADGQSLRVNLAINGVQSATVGGEVGGFVDERPRLGIRTGVGGSPESAAEVYRSELIGDWSRDASERIPGSKRYTHRRKHRYQARCKCSRRRNPSIGDY